MLALAIIPHHQRFGTPLGPTGEFRLDSVGAQIR
jgi:hypothetical protein